MPAVTNSASRSFGTGSVNVRLKCISSDQLIFNCSVRTPFPFIRRAQSTASAAPASTFLGIESAQRTRAPVRSRIDNGHLPSCRTTLMGHRGCRCARSNGYHVKLFGHAFITSTSRLLPQRCIQSSTLASSQDRCFAPRIIRNGDQLAAVRL